MPGIFLALTVVSGLCFVTALGWAILQWSRADRQVSAPSEDLERRLAALSDPST